MTIGNNIKRIRKEANMSQEDLADMFDVSRQTISNWENSKSYPDLETIVKISDNFNISLDVLLKEDLIMVKTFDNEIKNTRKYARALLAGAVVLGLIFAGFIIYSCVYFNTKADLEENFDRQLKENGFYMNRDGYYSMDYTDGVVFSVPDQSMPGLMDFSLDFHLRNLYCDISLEDRNIEFIWGGDNDFSASAVSKSDDKIVGSTSGFKENDFADMSKLSSELGIGEDDLETIIEKGNELYKDFYIK